MPLDTLDNIIDSVMSDAATAAKARTGIIRSEPVQNLADVLCDEVRAAFSEEVKSAIVEL
jgi:hypothetical protein